MDSWLFPSFSPAKLIVGLRGPEEAKNQRGRSPPPDSDPFSDAQFAKCLACLSRQFAASADRRFKFKKRRILFVATNDKPLPVVAMRVCNPDCSPLESIVATQPKLQSGFVEIVGDDFPILHAPIV
jgi:hypothetical protein